MKKIKKKKIDETLINWPQEGKIEFINFSARYRPDTDIVLKKINFEILPKQKIGIAGRTGSGKSTITLCLFRILEALEGKILIDDVDISTIGLDKLRSNLTIIPQDPALMEGTLRYNIDPLNKYNDSDIKEVMRMIGFDYILDKVINLRIFSDDAGRMNLSLLDTGGEILVVSQFTLFGDARHGRRPSYGEAAGNEKGNLYYQRFLHELKEKGIKTASGQFGADMHVSYTNDGPVTILLDSFKDF